MTAHYTEVIDRLVSTGLVQEIERRERRMARNAMAAIAVCVVTLFAIGYYGMRTARNLTYMTMLEVRIQDEATILPIAMVHPDGTVDVKEIRFIGWDSPVQKGE